MAANSNSSVITIQESTELKELERSPLRTTPSSSVPAQASSSSSRSPRAVDKTLSGAANLVKLLPTGTVLAFQALSPSFTNKGQCQTSNRFITGALILICTLSCIFFSFTDTIIGRDGKLYYGLATTKGMYIFNYDGEDEDRESVLANLAKYRIRVVDYVHAVLSVLVFLALTFGDGNVQQCFFPASGSNTKEALVNLPIGAAIFSGLVFMVFPTTRKGIGYSDAQPHNR